MAQLRHMTTQVPFSLPDTSQVSGLTPSSVGSPPGAWTADTVFAAQVEEHLPQCQELAPHWLESDHLLIG